MNAPQSKSAADVAQQQIANWVRSFIVKYNICPFARPDLDANNMRYCVAHSSDLETVLMSLVEECVFMDSNPQVNTSLFILPEGFEQFDDYLDLLDIANALLQAQGYEGTYQLASFHPDYCFEGEEESDAANYTNRAPLPVLHIIRESALAAALAEYKDPESIPERNIQFTRRKGANFFELILQACKASKAD
ncbi:DUF1415 domain-containing protein [Shewanella submarina]|uniref:DUF1415 domain-containing protein n=1 Tax=Shewanella submarina TaxID=2016376 RepID=A0ABV7G8M4_9GAMM|nr:DUF1415 domain-containing protein [Shewanella submarina]MCL1036773.1 DUF1415 domain-containing protein [Shewanella submarina]